jgi:hypothetical protein
VLAATARASGSIAFSLDLAGTVASGVIAPNATVELPFAPCPATTTAITAHHDYGYYEIAWPQAAPLGPGTLATRLAPRQAVALGDDAAGAVVRGELTAQVALTALAALAATGDLYAQLGAVAIAHAFDATVDDTRRAAWEGWLTRRFAARLTQQELLEPGSPAASELRAALVALIPPSAMPPQVVRTVAAVVDEALARGVIPAPALITIAGAVNGDARLSRLLELASAAHPEIRDEAFVALGRMPGAYIDRVLDLFLASDAPADQAWPAIAGFAQRGETRVAIWKAVLSRSNPFALRIGTARLAAMGEIGHLCDLGGWFVLLHAVAQPASRERDVRDAVDTNAMKLQRCEQLRTRLGDYSAALRH